MTEEFLKMIKESTYDEIKQNKLHNKKVDRVNKLLAYKCLKEYFSLVGEEPTRLKYYETDFEEIVNKVFNRAVYQIKDTETNHIYVYRNTYKSGDYDDIVHGPSDVIVGRNDPSAEFRTYHDLEQGYEINVPIRKCEEFEKNNHILFVGISRYYEIRQEFIIDAVKESQETAVKKVLKRYTKKNNNN